MSLTHSPTLHPMRQVPTCNLLLLLLHHSHAPEALVCSMGFRQAVLCNLLATRAPETAAHVTGQARLNRRGNVSWCIYLTSAVRSGWIEVARVTRTGPKGTMTVGACVLDERWRGPWPSGHQVIGLKANPSFVESWRGMRPACGQRRAAGGVTRALTR